VGQHDAAVQERQGVHRRGQGGESAVQDGRHRLEARGSRADGVHGEEDRREVRYLPYKSGGEAATQLVGNHTASNVNNPSENLEVWRARQVRALCVFDKERIAYKTKVTDTQSWNDIPTCKEEGLDMQYLMLRACSCRAR
jgi:tripartite-type tricarboxylate transporter receptor subunit TctC